MTFNVDLMEHISPDKAKFSMDVLNGDASFPPCFVLRIEARPNESMKFFATGARMQELSDFIHGELIKVEIADRKSVV